MKAGLGHHHKTGNHDMDEYDWNCFMDFADQAYEVRKDSYNTVKFPP